MFWSFSKLIFFSEKRQHRFCLKTPKVYGSSVPIGPTHKKIECDRKLSSDGTDNNARFFNIFFVFFLNGCNDFAQKLIRSKLGQYSVPILKKNLKVICCFVWTVLCTHKKKPSPIFFYIVELKDSLATLAHPIIIVLRVYLCCFHVF